ncbi:hypothetical protein WA158_004727 [Blastocystis sp. Blastoise]
MKVFAVLALIFALASAEVYFNEKFEEGYEKRWVKPTNWRESSQMGTWKWTAGQWYADVNDKGIQTSPDARFHGYSAKMDKVFDNENKDLVLQYSAKYEQEIDCGGAYIKLLPDGIDQESFGGDAPYAIMFGPDVCGSEKRKTHIIFGYKGKNLEAKKNFRAVVDQLSHLYTLIIHPDNTYEYLIDGAKENSGSLYDEWDFVLPREIADPSAKKPEDWVDEAEIVDPEDKKPEDWDDQPAEIADPDAKKPDDWDDEDDGDWEAPMIANPEYKGEWTPKKIPNPEYKGEWKAPMIANPDFVDDETIYHVCKNCNYVGFELWQVKSGSIFDDILVTDDVQVAAQAAEAFNVKAKAEKAMYESIKEVERKKAEEESAKAAEAEKSEPQEEEEEDNEEEL